MRVALPSGSVRRWGLFPIGECAGVVDTHAMLHRCLLACLFLVLMAGACSQESTSRAADVSDPRASALDADTVGAEQGATSASPLTEPEVTTEPPGSPAVVAADTPSMLRTAPLLDLTSPQPLRQVDFGPDFSFDCPEGAARGDVGIICYSDLEYADSLAIVEVNYGDVTGDGIEEALVVARGNTQGSIVYSRVTVFGESDGRLVRIGDTQAGDRAIAGLRDVAARDGLLVTDVSMDSGACCEVGVRSVWYEVIDGGLELVDGPEHVRGLEDEGAADLVSHTGGVQIRGSNDQEKRTTLVGPPGSEFVVWSNDLSPSVIHLIDKSTDELGRWTRPGARIAFPASGRLELHIEPWAGNRRTRQGEPIVVPVAPYSVDVVPADVEPPPINRANGQTFRDDRVSLVGPGRPIALSADGSSLLTADIPAESGGSCDLVPSDQWSLRILGDGTRQASRVSPTVAVVSLVSSDDWIVWVEGCGRVRQVLASRRAPNGELGEPAPLSVLDGPSRVMRLDADGTVWIRHGEFGGAATDQQIDLATGQLLVTVENAEPLAVEPPTVTWSDVEAAWVFHIDGDVMVNRSLPPGADIHPTVVIDQERGVLYAAVRLVGYAWRTIAVPLGDGSTAVGEPIAQGQALIATQAAAQHTFASLPEIDGWLAWETSQVTHCGPGELVVVDVWGNSTGTGVETSRLIEVDARFQNGWLTAMENANPCDGPTTPLAVEILPDGTVATVVR